MRFYFGGIVLTLMVLLVVGAWRLRTRRVTLGPGAAAMMHELMADDRRAAIDVMIEERTGERDPEDRDGNFPELAALKRQKSN